MAARRWVDGLSHLRTNCLYTPGSAPGPTLGNKHGKTLPLPLPSLSSLSAVKSTEIGNKRTINIKKQLFIHNVNND